MNSPNAELAVTDGAAEIAAPLPRAVVGGARVRGRAAGRPSSLRWGLLRAHVGARLRARAAGRSREQHVLSREDAALGEPALAVREAARALLGSRAVIGVGVAAVVLSFGYGPLRHAFNPP